MKFKVNQLAKRRKNIALKAKVTQGEEDGENQEIDSDEEMALIVRELKRIMNKKKFGKKGQSSKKNRFEGKIASIVVRLDIYQLIAQTRRRQIWKEERQEKCAKEEEILQEGEE
jgi:flagellar basal body L-ring protein FlgH